MKSRGYHNGYGNKVIRMSSDSVYVYVKSSVASDAEIAGRLDFFDDHVDFRYARKWLDNPRCFSFHPELLPLNASVYSAKALDGALSVFRDTGPGIWGKALLRKQYGQISLSDSLVLSNNVLRIGVLRYSRDYDAASGLLKDGEKAPVVGIEDIYAAVKALEDGEPLDEFQSSILAQGSSMDGMRPKSFIEMDGGSWIVKFPSKNDYDNKGCNELVGMRLARACGIETPDVKLIRLGDKKHAVAIKRFDTDGTMNYPLMSAASAMGYVEGEFIKADYRYVAQTLNRLSVDPESDRLSLFKRMALNVMISNRDDHLFNQALIMRGDGWKLSPVYDVVCGEGNRRAHAMTIGKRGAQGRLDNVLSAAGSFGLNKEQAKSIVDDVANCVAAQWKALAKDGGIAEADIKGIEWAVLHAEIFSVE